MSEDLNGSARADAVRIANKELDERLRALAAAIPVDRLHADPGEGKWTLAENLAHIAEFSRYFAVDLAAQLRQEGAPVGRTHDHAARNAAIAVAKSQGIDDLRTALDRALDALAEQLDELRSEHLDRMGENRKYGSEPLHQFLDRYVLGHKAAHVEQLETTIKAVQRRAHAPEAS